MSQENVELVRGTYAAFARKDMADIKTRLAPDFTIEQSTELPWGGSYHGEEGLPKFFAALFARVTSSVSFERFIDAGDHVVAIGRTQGTVVGTGEPFDVPIAHVWRVRDGRLVMFRPYVDNPTMLAALG